MFTICRSLVPSDSVTMIVISRLPRRAGPTAPVKLYKAGALDPAFGLVRLKDNDVEAPSNNAETELTTTLPPLPPGGLMMVPRTGIEFEEDGGTT